MKSTVGWALPHMTTVLIRRGHMNIETDDIEGK